MLVFRSGFIPFSLLTAFGTALSYSQSFSTALPLRYHAAGALGSHLLIAAWLGSSGLPLRKSKSIMLVYVLVFLLGCLVGFAACCALVCLVFLALDDEKQPDESQRRVRLKSQPQRNN
jgi:hypothetical protein